MLVFGALSFGTCLCFVKQLLIISFAWNCKMFLKQVPLKIPQNGFNCISIFPAAWLIDPFASIVSYHVERSPKHKRSECLPTSWLSPRFPAFDIQINSCFEKFINIVLNYICVNIVFFFISRTAEHPLSFGGTVHCWQPTSLVSKPTDLPRLPPAFYLLFLFF